MSFEITAISGW